MNRATEQIEEKVRLDKWLWAARFFKTRQIAAEAISGGKVHLNGQRTKPGKEIKAGSQLRIHKGALEWEITVRVLATKRRPASEARSFYDEPPASIERRERLVEAQRLERSMAPRIAHGRPNKKDRRMIHRFTGKSS
ncbi:MAG: RNA-binding protein S4 [gamma proteobacterium symbiont of Ctena orbiculata]|uniref:Heat shock protein 15 n=1 Tax=Candidatus Thiodiazotropha taylori TaxID=2792791 RepID=A0A944M7A4_9GAMM|nr:RNA-binding S4 domain-containing protein [Candidatus Thiodiazotropha taylori]PUB84463.1 MAG: RNA-binding protein S4 [gamma proteobacterium symbiont of Ctena orbiculata]MBT2988483.1 RNA-binding S4 domain-containing protein [Candidatus Thiodiazotropha taylori]MBT2997389.1 RNA-binding S4 domain-containing protein [Candidatus Thiodiazotropha taylori]MBT3000901.1 RNA-binding S4 domain-containing protein [Candidatus Thiodiazotropha taylori]